MKKIRSLFKKMIISLTISAITLILAVSSVGAVTTNVLQDYTASLDQNGTFQPVSWMVGYFESGTNNHNGRAGTHYNPGTLNGKAVTKLYYMNSYHEIVPVQYDGASTSKNYWGWIESSWVEAPDDYISCIKINFYGYKYNSYGNLIIIDRIDVND